mgnify:CR=1 FL=1
MGLFGFKEYVVERSVMDAFSVSALVGYLVCPIDVS